MSTKKKPPKAPSIELPDDPEEREKLIQECEEALEKLLRKRLESGDDFATYEKMLLEIAHEVVRRKLEKKLQTIADGFEDRLAIDHTNDRYGLREGTAFAFRRHSPGTATYHSLVATCCGAAHISRVSPKRHDAGTAGAIGRADGAHDTRGPRLAEAALVLACLVSCRKEVVVEKVDPLVAAIEAQRGVKALKRCSTFRPPTRRRAWAPTGASRSRRRSSSTRPAPRGWST
jgi:hypothetical protein